jgi:hypothetical protein
MNEPRVLIAALARKLNTDTATLNALCERYRERLESLHHTADGLLTLRQALYISMKFDSDEAFEAQREIIEASVRHMRA